MVDRITCRATIVDIAIVLLHLDELIEKVNGNITQCIDLAEITDERDVAFSIAMILIVFANYLLDM